MRKVFTSRTYSYWLILEHFLSKTEKQMTKLYLAIDIRETRRSNQEWTIQRHCQHWVHKTEDEDKKNTTQNIKKMSNTDPTKNRGFLLLIRHPSCYSYTQSGPVKVMVMIEERKNLRKKSKIHCQFRYGYFISVNQIVMTTV